MITSNRSSATFEALQEKSEERAAQSVPDSPSENITANRSVLTGRFSHDGSSSNLIAKAYAAEPIAQPTVEKRTVIEMSFKAAPRESNQSSQRITETSVKVTERQIVPSFRVEVEVPERRISQRIIHTIKNSESPIRSSATGKDNGKELTLKPLLRKKQMENKPNVRNTLWKLQLMNQALIQNKGATQQTFEGGNRSTQQSAYFGPTESGEFKVKLSKKAPTD